MRRENGISSKNATYISFLFIKGHGIRACPKIIKNFAKRKEPAKYTGS